MNTRNAAIGHPASAPPAKPSFQAGPPGLRVFRMRGTLPSLAALILVMFAAPDAGTAAETDGASGTPTPASSTLLAQAPRAPRTPPPSAPEFAPPGYLGDVPGKPFGAGIPGTTARERAGTARERREPEFAPPGYGSGLLEPPPRHWDPPAPRSRPDAEPGRLQERPGRTEGRGALPTYPETLTVPGRTTGGIDGTALFPEEGYLAPHRATGRPPRHEEREHQWPSVPTGTYPPMPEFPGDRSAAPRMSGAPAGHAAGWPPPHGGQAPAQPVFPGPGGTTWPVHPGPGTANWPGPPSSAPAVRPDAVHPDPFGWPGASAPTAPAWQGQSFDYPSQSGDRGWYPETERRR